MSRLINSLLLIIFLSFLLPVSAMAHKVNIFAFVDGQTVFSESYFPDGRPVEGGTVRVFDKAEKELLTGETDNAGQFNFELPDVSPIILEIDAGMGHKNRFKLKKTATQE